MIDHLVGRPNPSWKRTQVFLVIFFWLWRIVRGNAGPPRVAWLRRANKYLRRFTPWQIIISTLTTLYAVRNFDKILGLGSPEPLARLYSPSYYRATWISTGLDAGFATAMSIRPKWLRDICSIIFSGYYILYANEGDEKLRRFRAVPTVEMLRVTWEKTTNPYIRILTHLPRVATKRKVLLPRPVTSEYRRPVTGYLFFYPPEEQLEDATELILDFPGGGFVAMSPEHHEERLRMWAVKTGKPVLSIDYGKAPEYPYPYAIDEAFDTYKILVDSAGTLIGMSGKKLSIVISGDSAGATLAVNVIFKIIDFNNAPKQLHNSLPQPVALVLNYPALDFNFTSWMSATNLQVLRSEQSSGNLPGLRELAAQKDHLQHISPLSMVKDNRFSTPRSKRLRRRRSWKDAIRELTSGSEQKPNHDVILNKVQRSASSVKVPSSHGSFHRLWVQDRDDKGTLADAESDEDEDYDRRKEEDRPIRARVRYTYPHTDTPATNQSELTPKEMQQDILAGVGEAGTRATEVSAGKPSEYPKPANEPIGTRLTMTSRTGYFQDRIVSPSMMRAMAILYIGPHRDPDFATDYRLSPILAPAHLLAQFPPLLLQCGEKDPFVDDTVIFAGRLREAKRARKTELDLIISGKSARFGEGLRMSNMEALDDNNLVAMRAERDKLARETEADWVQMVLFSDWSHGYLQMPTLMIEAKAVIEELAEWIDEAFSKNVPEGCGDGSASDMNLNNQERLRPSQPSNAVTSSETETDDFGITFVPKKYQNGSATCFDDDLQKIVMPTAETMAMNDFLHTARKQLVNSKPTHLGEYGASSSAWGESRECATPDSGNAAGPIAEENRPSSTPRTPATPKQTGSRQAGTPITETELMRRRRLLDSHIFE